MSASIFSVSARLSLIYRVVYHIGKMDARERERIKELERNVSYEILRVLYISNRKRSRRLNGNSKRKQRYAFLSDSLRCKTLHMHTAA